MSLKDKINRMKPIIRARQAILDKETLVLAKLLKEKEANQKDLLSSQESYMKGIRQLAHCRNDPFRHGQETLERCVDYTKKMWTDLFKKNQTIEKKIDGQRLVLNLAKRKLKEVEKLQERYQEQSIEFYKKKENEKIDEYNINKYNNSDRNDS